MNTFIVELSAIPNRNSIGDWSCTHNRPCKWEDDTSDWGCFAINTTDGYKDYMLSCLMYNKKTSNRLIMFNTGEIFYKTRNTSQVNTTESDEYTSTTNFTGGTCKDSNVYWHDYANFYSIIYFLFLLPSKHFTNYFIVINHIKY